MCVKYFCFVSLCFLSLLPNTCAARVSTWVGNDLKGFSCQGRRENYGPFDYRSSFNRKNKLPIVEEYHFTRDVQTLNKGTSSHLVNDIGYTLRAFPNHYKALNALIYYQLLKRSLRPVDPPVECYFLRALNFVPTDATVRMLFAVYLKKIKQYVLADHYYQQAIALQPNDLRFRYIYGLFLVKQKKYELAKEQAQIVYAKKYPQQKLKQKLIKIGHWK